MILTPCKTGSRRGLMQFFSLVSWKSAENSAAQQIGSYASLPFNACCVLEQYLVHILGCIWDLALKDLQLFRSYAFTLIFSLGTEAGAVQVQHVSATACQHSLKQMILQDLGCSVTQAIQQGHILDPPFSSGDKII